MIACIDVLGGFVGRGSGCNSGWVVVGDLAILMCSRKPQGKPNICIDYSGVFSVYGDRSQDATEQEIVRHSLFVEWDIVCLSVWFILLMTNKPIYRQRKYASQSIVCVPRYCDADKKEDNAAPIRSMLHVAIRVVLKEIPEIRMSKHQDCSKEKK